MQSHPETKAPTADALPVGQGTERDDLNYSLIQSVALPSQAPILDVKECDTCSSLGKYPARSAKRVNSKQIEDLGWKL